MEHCVLALGFFDGVHLGHGGLLRLARRHADERGCLAACVTFDRHPASLVRGEEPLLLNTADERALLMQEKYGIDRVFALRFDEELRQEHWESFARRMREEYGACHMICGHDFRFGMDGEGTPDLLRTYCERNGLGFDCVEKITMDDITVSSTHIRSLLQVGETAAAVRFLGHGHLISGEVVDGRKIGRTLGVPTANVRLAEGILVPKCGVYAAEACVEGQRYAAVLNIGTRPTFDGSNITVEPWILDFEGDLYGKTIELWLYTYLREERRFSSREELKEEILRNASQTRRFLAARRDMRSGFRPLNGQGLCDYASVPYGWRKVKDNGCGLLAAYNALGFYGREMDFSEIRRFFHRWWRPRFFGTSALQLRRFFRKMGYSVEIIPTASELEERLKEGGIAIQLQWNRAMNLFGLRLGNPLKGSHIITLRWEDKLAVYNRFSNRARRYAYGNMQDLLSKGAYICGLYLTEPEI